jgi:hypothetical protein
MPITKTEVTERWSHHTFKPGPCETESPYDLLLSVTCCGNDNHICILRFTSHRFETPLDEDTCLAVYVHMVETIHTSDPCVQLLEEGGGFVLDGEGRPLWGPPENWPPSVQPPVDTGTSGVGTDGTTGTTGGHEQPEGEEPEEPQPEDGEETEEPPIPDPQEQIGEYLDHLLGGHVSPPDQPCASTPPKFEATFECKDGKWVIKLTGTATWARTLPNGRCERVEVPVERTVPTGMPCDPADWPPLDWRTFLRDALAAPAEEESHGLGPRMEKDAQHAGLPVGHEKRVPPRYRAAVEVIRTKERVAGMEHIGEPRVVYVEAMDRARMTAEALARKSPRSGPTLRLRIAGSLFSEPLVDAVAARGGPQPPKHPHSHEEN